MTSAYEKLNELLEVHKDFPMTTNSQFINNSKTFKQDISKEMLEEAMRKTLLDPTQKVTVEDISRLLSTIGPASNLDMDLVAAEEAFDNMNAYYEVYNFSPSFRHAPSLIPHRSH